MVMTGSIEMPFASMSLSWGGLGAYGTEAVNAGFASGPAKAMNAGVAARTTHCAASLSATAIASAGAAETAAMSPPAIARH